MKVFQLNTFCGIKSTGRIAAEIALLLEEQGHVCRIGYGAEAPPVKWERFAYRVGGPIERKVHGAIRKFFDAEGYGSQLGTLRLIRELKRFQPDIIHLHNIHGCYLHFGILFRYLKKNRIPLIWTLHDCWPMTGHCAYFEYAKCFKWQAECGHCPQLLNYPPCYGLDGSKRNLRHKKALFSGLPAMSWVTPSNWLKTYVEESWLNQYPAQVIYNGVDLSVLAPADVEENTKLRQKHRITAKHVVLAVAADWDGRKGLSYLLEAVKQWDEDYQLVVIGLSEAQINELPAGILGIAATKDVSELKAWYSLADCLANPTMEDNMPMVNLEALACGTPVVVFSTGGCPEVIDDTCGRVIPQGDAEALAKAVQDIAPLKEQLSAGCRARAKQLESRSCYLQYVQRYEELLE